eukprot:6484381-Amphidinium_carterae.2
MVYGAGCEDDANILMYSDYILHNEEEQTRQGNKQTHHSYDMQMERRHMRRNERIWKRAYARAIMRFGEKRNLPQKLEAIWIGRDTTQGQHIAISPDLGRITSRTVRRLP